MSASLLLLLLWCCLAGAGGVYYSPLSTQCPDTTSSASALRHNDVFLYDHDFTGDFPDIKRSVTRRPSDSGAPEARTSHVSNLSNKRSSDIGADGAQPGSFRSSRESRWKEAESGDAGFSQGRPQEAQNLFRSEHTAPRPSPLSSGQRQDQTQSPDFWDQHNKAGHSESWDVSGESTTPAGWSVTKPHLLESVMSSKLGTSLGNRPSAERGRNTGGDAHTDVTKSELWSYFQELSHPQSSSPFQGPRQENSQQHIFSEGISPPCPQRGSRSSGSEFLERYGRSTTRSVLPRHLESSGRPTQPNQLELFHDLQHINPTLWSILSDMNSGQRSTGSPVWNSTGSMINVLLHCLGKDPHSLNTVSPVTSTHQAHATRQAEKRERITLDHGNNSSPQGRGLEYKNKVPQDIHHTDRPKMSYQELFEAISSLAQSARAYKHGVLANFQQYPRITKRLSFVHPTCLNDRLDFVKSTDNIDADLLQFLAELTDAASSPADSDETSSAVSQKRQAQHSDFQHGSRSDLRQNLKTILFHGAPTLKLPNHRGRGQISRSLLGVNGQPDSDRVGHLDETEVKSTGQLSVQNNSTARGEQSTPHRPSKRTGLPHRFSPEAALPWSCPSVTRWRDLGMHVFPRYVQETVCGQDSSSSDNINSESTTCWYGFYNCRPITSAVEVLVRHTGACNDRRVPQNMREHYFLSIISINTGCNCV